MWRGRWKPGVLGKAEIGKKHVNYSDLKKIIFKIINLNEIKNKNVYFLLFGKWK